MFGLVYVSNRLPNVKLFLPYIIVISASVKWERSSIRECRFHFQYDDDGIMMVTTWSSEFTRVDGFRWNLSGSVDVLSALILPMIDEDSGHPRTTSHDPKKVLKLPVESWALSDARVAQK